MAVLPLVIHHRKVVVVILGAVVAASSSVVVVVVVVMEDVKKECQIKRIMKNTMMIYCFIHMMYHIVSHLHRCCCLTKMIWVVVVVEVAK